MKNAWFTSLLALVSISGFAEAQAPLARREMVREKRFGILLEDPYRWMENGDDIELADWAKAQNEFTLNQLDTDLHQTLKKEFTELIQATRDSLADEEEDTSTRFFWQRRSPKPFGLNRIEKSLSAKKRYRIDEKSDTASDLKVLQIYDTQEEKYLPDLMFAKFASIVWADDELSFIYASDLDARIQDTRPVIRKHVLGTAQNQDVTLYESRAADIEISIIEAGEHILVLEGEGYVGRLGKLIPEAKSVEWLCEPKDLLAWAGYDQEKNTAYLLSFQDAPMGKVVALNLTDKTETTLVAEDPAAAIDQVVQIKNDLFITYIVDVAHTAARVNLRDGTAQKISLPGVGTVAFAEIEESEEVKITFSSYSEPISTWKLNLASNELTLMASGESLTHPLESLRVAYRDHEGRERPIWIVKRKDVTLNPKTPVYLYGYGGFAVNILPKFSKAYLPFLMRGGVVATVTLPGGLEFGNNWHRAGMLHNKMNVFNDFAAAGLTLIEKGYTSTRHLAIGGGSNGGLLVGATMNLYPNLFYAAIPEVGVMDMTRFELFTAGKWWTPEYGKRTQEGDFLFQLSISPYHNLRARTRYPNTLVITADADDRVVPAHSYKYAAQLQKYQSKSRDAFLYVKQGASHSSLSGTIASRAEYLATKWAFIWDAIQ